MSVKKEFFSNEQVARWIWLNEKVFPLRDHKMYTSFCEGGKMAGGNEFSVVAFERTFNSESEGIMLIRSSADCTYVLRINGKTVMRGPKALGGDYENKAPAEYRFYDEFFVEIKRGQNKISADVLLYPEVMSDRSCGKGGFYFYSRLPDGKEIVSDDSWLAAVDGRYKKRGEYDLRVDCKPETHAVEVEDICALRKSDLKNLVYEKIEPVEQRDNLFDFAKTYSAYVQMRIESDREAYIEAGYYEKEGYIPTGKEKIIVPPGVSFFESLKMFGLRYIKVSCSDGVKVFPSLSFCHYPVTQTGCFECSDKDLNRLFELCRHTERICMQSYHLDSPVHQEALGCIGDYLIESLIDFSAFGEYALTKSDILSVTEYLENSRGKLFHTIYSLIYFEWIKQYVAYSGDEKIWKQTEKARNAVLDGFIPKIDKDGLCSADNYLFIDWVQIEEFNLHHPPKVLGQAVLNAFLYNALKINARKEDLKTAKKIKKAFNKHLWDKKRGLYISGLPEKNYEEHKNFWLPDGGTKTYYCMHANALAALFGLRGKKSSRLIMEKVMNNRTPVGAQPYFMYFVFAALQKTRLFGKYALKEMRRWLYLADDGNGTSLKEVWNGFDCDYSHAWSGAPLVFMMKAILGIQPKLPGFKKYKFKPNLCGLEYARGVVPTPYGVIEANITKNHSCAKIKENI